MRTTEIGACTPPKGTMPGIRLPVRTITRPPISSRRIRFGEPTSWAPSGVIVAAFRPSPASRTAAAAWRTISFRVARRDSSERSNRGKRSSSPVTSGARTRSASSSSSCPVSSPSRTTIAFPAIRPTLLPGLGLRLRGYTRTLWLAEGGGSDSARGDGFATSTPVGGESKTTSAAARREAPGDGPRQGRAAPVPLPPGVPSPAGAGEVRQAHRVRREAAGPARRDGEAHRAGAAQLRVDGGGGPPGDQPRLVPRRRRSLREDVPDVRDHDAAQGARARAREQNRLSL